MRPSRRGLVIAACLLKICLLNICLPSLCLSVFAAFQTSDQIAAERVLGPRWEQLSRRAGMIFAGTVLATPSGLSLSDSPVQTSTTPSPSIQEPPGATSAIELTFRVDVPIAGVERGQVLTIHEWAGAWAMHRPMSKGQHILIFLYPPSRLGLTSPVGGSLGQVALDSSGNSVAPSAQESAISSRPDSSLDPRAREAVANVSVMQLERAIRGARNEQ